MLTTYEATQELKEMLKKAGISFKESTHYAQARAEIKHLLDDFEELDLIDKDGKLWGYIEARTQYGVELFNVWEIYTYTTNRHTFLQTETKALMSYIIKVASLH